MHFVDERCVPEEVMQDGRGDVVGKIAVEAERPAGSERSEIGFQNVVVDDGKPRELLGEASEAGCEGSIHLEGDNRSAAGEQIAGHFAVARANLDPAVLIIGRQRHGGMRGDANRAGDLLAPPKIREKMLTKALARHGKNSLPAACRTGSDRHTKVCSKP